MPFKKGNKEGGRLKGSKNKMTYALDACLQRGFSPFDQLVEYALGHDKAKGLEATKELCRYLAPHLKAIEVKGDLKVTAKVMVRPNGEQRTYDMTPKEG
jgi:hypothetical protein